MITVPRFPLLETPEAWDDLTLVAATIYLEAKGEPDEGQVAVGWVIRERMTRWGLTLQQVLLGPEGKAYGDGKPYEPYSCWNDDYQQVAEAKLGAATGEDASRAWRAAAGALWRLLPNPVESAMYYLNVELTKKIRRDGKLPTWAADPQDPKHVNTEKVVAVLGRHTFVRA